MLQEADPSETPGFDSRFEELFLDAYPDLIRIAAFRLRSNGNLTLTCRTLIQEVFLKLRKYPELAGRSPEDLKTHAVVVMRRLIVDYFRERNAGKRGGPDAVRSPLEESIPAPERALNDEAIALHEALDQLAKAAPRQAKVIELNYFGGFHQDEIAESLAISLGTVQNDLRNAKAWLKQELLKGKRPQNHDA